MSHKFFLTIILLLSLFLRSINLNQSLWHDEAVTVVASRATELIPLITKYTLADFHPPGYFAILWGWIKILGSSEIAVRVPSVIFGFFTIVFTFLIGKKLFSRKVGLISSFLLALSPLHIYYSQEARMYSFAAFAGAFSIYALIRLIKKEKYGTLLYAFSVFLVLYSDYVAYFILVPELIFVVLHYRGGLKKYVSSLLFGLVTILPWLLIFPKQLEVGRKTAGVLGGWRDVVGGATFKTIEVFLAKLVVGRITFENKFLYAVIVGTTLLTAFYIIIGLVKKKDKNINLLLFWLLIPPIAGFLTSFFIPVFSYFRFIFVLPAFYLLLAKGFEESNFSKNKILILGSLTIFVIVELFSSLTYLLKSSFQREDWRGATAYVDQNTSTQTQIFFKDISILSGYQYYTRVSNRAFPAFTKVPVENFSDVANFNSSTSKKIIVFDYLTDITDPKKLLENKLVSENFKEKEVKDFRGVGFVKTFESIK